MKKHLLDVTAIGYCAFDGTLTIGENVSYIGDYAFRNCPNFTHAVSLATTPPQLGVEFGGMVFNNFGVLTLTVPCGCIEAYQSSAWYDPYGMVGFYEFIEDCGAASEVGNLISAVYPNPTNGIVKIEAEDIQKHQHLQCFRTSGL